MHYLKTGKRFILLRRWAADISTLWIEQYFADVDVERITNGKYNCITVWRKVLYFGNIDETNKVKKGEKIGYVIALSTEQHMSSASFLDVDMIIFEEFMERGGIYLSHEPDRLMIFYNTIDRKRGTTQLWMVGNTISKVNPYLRDWGLQPIIRNQKQGEIKIITIHNEENDVTLAIEYCESSGGKQMAIGNASKMIDTGAWQSEPQPHLPHSRKDYTVVYRIGFQFQGFKFIGEYLKYNNKSEYCWFIYPKYNEFKDKTIVISDVVKLDSYWQRNIYDITIKNDNLKLLLDTFRESNIFYCDDMTGTDFKEAIDFQIRR